MTLRESSPSIGLTRHSGLRCRSNLTIAVFQEPSGAPGLQVYLPRSAIDVSPTSHVPLPVPGTSRVEADDTWAWYDAPVPPPGGFLVNVGLAMELWSSGAYKATLHRVIFPDEGALGDRDTLAFFVQPDDDVVGGHSCPFRSGPPRGVGHCGGRDHKSCMVVKDGRR